jgi:adenylosuccinate lyase
MPFKRNPVNAENIDSLARFVAALPRVAWDNAAHSLLERTLDDSGSRRLILPQAFLLCDELVSRAHAILRDLIVRDDAVAQKMETYGTFAATERLLMELVKAGADRQAMHEVIRQHSLAAWDVIQRDAAQGNPLPDLLASDPTLLDYLPAEQVRTLLDAKGYVGDAPQRARDMAVQIRQAIGR